MKPIPTQTVEASSLVPAPIAAKLVVLDGPDEGLEVPLEGESGTGKELAARSIHRASPRASGPYVVFDCGSVPGELAESELFGHKKGAFSGAVDKRQGAFQRASGGTICLDELGELPLDLQ